jgi:hypothetical protein
LALRRQWDLCPGHGRLTRRERRVATDIARRVNSTTLTTNWVSDAEIADFLKIDRVHVCKARTELQRLGWIARKAGRFKSRYTLCSLNIDPVLQEAELRQGMGQVFRGHPSRKKNRAAAWPLSARAQQAAMPVVGFVNGGSADAYAHPVAAFRKGLGESGYIEGQNVTVEYHWLEGQYERIP